MDKSQWKISNRFIAMLIIAFGIAFLAMQILPMLASTGRLYGNKLMRLKCYQRVKALRNAETNSPNFNFFKLSDDNKRDTILHGWNPDFWIKTNFTWEASEANRQIIVVCGKEFDNVPKPGFWNYFWRNPAHAVGYSDGQTGLISPDKFTNLISAGFVSVASLATNSEFNIFK
ncbi:MAG TPA: hypothetical protein VIK53_12575 [Verrucomicrobiae bacterium]